jgi:two-component system nitrogen regulation sensor histidine kinase NtrY
MKLQTKYLLFVSTLHTAALVMSYYIFLENKLWFLLAEVVIFGSVLLSWQLFNQMIRPLKLLVQGAKAISDRDFTVKLVETGMLEMDQLIFVYNQMIEELRKERTKQQQQHFFLEKLILNSPVGIIILDHDNRIQQVNPSAKNILHTITPEGWLLNDIDHPIFNEISTMLGNKQGTTTLHGAKIYKIQVSEFIDLGFPRHFVLLQELTAELLEAEKMAYGKVIRMMAHEVNNTIGPVNSILQSAYTMQVGSALSGNLANALQVAMDRNNNLNKFMRNLADVVRLPEPKKMLMNIHDLVADIATLMAETAAKKGIAFEFNFCASSLQILADQLLMEQVLINVVKNAIEAIDDSAGGKITFITGISPKKLVIRDNGKGIGPEVGVNLFSPFFSTKADGQGIGLTLIKDVLIKHGFQFNLAENTSGETEFTIIV